MIKAVVIVQLCAVAYQSCMSVKAEGEFPDATDQNCTNLITEIMEPALEKLEKETGVQWFIKSGDCYSDTMKPGKEI